jgi:hypothetical protein
MIKINHKIIATSRSGRFTFSSLTNGTPSGSSLSTRGSIEGSISIVSMIKVDGNQQTRVNVPGTGDCGPFAILARLDQTRDSIGKETEVSYRGHQFTAKGLRTHLADLIKNYPTEQDPTIKEMIRNAYRESSRDVDISSAGAEIAEKQVKINQKIESVLSVEDFKKWLATKNKHEFFEKMYDDIKDTIEKACAANGTPLAKDESSLKIAVETTIAKAGTYKAHIGSAAKKCEGFKELGITKDELDMLKADPAKLGEQAGDQDLDLKLQTDLAFREHWASSITKYSGDSNSYYLNRFEMFLIAKKVGVNLNIAVKQEDGSYKAKDEYQKNWGKDLTITVIYEGSHFNYVRDQKPEDTQQSQGSSQGLAPLSIEQIIALLFGGQNSY